MKLIDKIKSSFLNHSVQVNQVPSAPVPQPQASAPDMKIINALDAAVDVLEKPNVQPPASAPDTKILNAQPAPGVAASALRTDGPTPEEWLAAGYTLKTYPPAGFAPKLSAEEIKAAEARKSIREDIRRMTEQNQRDAEKARQQKAEAEKLAAQKAAAQKVETWESKFKTLCRPDYNMALTKPLLAKLLDAGKLHDVRTQYATKVAPLLDAWDVAFEARSKNTRVEFKRQMMEGIAENAQRLKDGYSELIPLPNEAALETQFSIVRAQCSQRQEEVSKQFNPVLLELVGKLQNAARQLALERLAAEKSEAESFGVDFQPSCVLLKLIGTGYHLLAFVELNALASKLCSPRTTLYGLLDPEAQWN